MSHGVPNARRNAEWMLCYSLGLEHARPVRAVDRVAGRRSRPIATGSSSSAARAASRSSTSCREPSSCRSRSRSAAACSCRGPRPRCWWSTAERHSAPRPLHQALARSRSVLRERHHRRVARGSRLPNLTVRRGRRFARGGRADGAQRGAQRRRGPRVGWCEADAFDFLERRERSFRRRRVQSALHRDRRAGDAAARSARPRTACAPWTGAGRPRLLSTGGTAPGARLARRTVS